MTLAIINCSDTNEGLMPPGSGRYPNPSPAANNAYGSVFFHILPYIEKQNLYNETLRPAGGDPTNENGASNPSYSPFWGYLRGNIKTYICPSDPTNPPKLYPSSIPGGGTYNAISYASNGQVFPWFDNYSKLPGSIVDGASNTIFLSERSVNCQSVTGTGASHWYNASSFATDKNKVAVVPKGEGWYPLFSPLPVDTCGGHCPEGGCTNADTASEGQPSSYHTGGIQVSMGDGSVRLVPQGISLGTWLSACTKSAGDVLGPDW